MGPLISLQNTWSVEPLLQKVGMAQAKQGNDRDSQSRKKISGARKLYFIKTKKKEIRYVRTQTTSFLLPGCVLSWVWIRLWRGLTNSKVNVQQSTKNTFIWKRLLHFSEIYTLFTKYVNNIRYGPLENERTHLKTNSPRIFGKNTVHVTMFHLELILLRDTITTRLQQNVRHILQSSVCGNVNEALVYLIVWSSSSHY